MKQGLKGISKRQLKKITSEHYFFDTKKSNSIYKMGMREFTSICLMAEKGKDKEKIFEKALNALNYGLKVENIQWEDFIKNYKETNYYNRPYSPYNSMEKAFARLVDYAGYISDRYCEYRFYQFFYLLELCAYYLGKETISNISFLSDNEVVENFKSLFIPTLDKLMPMDEFIEYYNGRITELEEINGESPYWEMDEFNAFDSLRTVTEEKKSFESDLNKFHLYQLFFSLRSAEKSLKRELYPLQSNLALK